MSEFVNYKKRGVTLPNGCKDLIDVLQPQKPSKVIGKVQAGTISPDEKPVVTRGQSFIGGFSDIQEYMAMVFAPRDASFLLRVTPPDEKFTVNVDRIKDGTMMASVTLQTGTEQERAVRSFFAERGLQVPRNSEIPPMFVPELPIQIVFEVLPFPSTALLLSQFVSDVIRIAFGMSEDSRLRFCYYEINAAAD